MAERLGAGIAKALLGKYVVPDDLPYVTGTLGLLGTRPSSDMMNKCDTLLMVGTCYPVFGVLAARGTGARHTDRHRCAQYRLAFPTEVNLIGDSRETLAALLPLLTLKPENAWRDKIAKNLERLVRGRRGARAC